MLEGMRLPTGEAVAAGGAPDLKIHVSRSVIDADDGPLLATLQGLDGAALRVPQEPLARPDPAFLEWRSDRFEAAQTR